MLENKIANEQCRWKEIVLFTKNRNDATAYFYKHFDHTMSWPFHDISSECVWYRFYVTHIGNVEYVIMAACPEKEGYDYDCTLGYNRNTGLKGKRYYTDKAKIFISNRCTHSIITDLIAGLEKLNLPDKIRKSFFNYIMLNNPGITYEFYFSWLTDKMMSNIDLKNSYSICMIDFKKQLDYMLYSKKNLYNFLKKFSLFSFKAKGNINEYQYEIMYRYCKKYLDAFILNRKSLTKEDRILMLDILHCFFRIDVIYGECKKSKGINYMVDIDSGKILNDKSDIKVLHLTYLRYLQLLDLFANLSTNKDSMQLFVDICVAYANVNLSKKDSLKESIEYFLQNITDVKSDKKSYELFLKLVYSVKDILQMAEKNIDLLSDAKVNVKKKNKLIMRKQEVQSLDVESKNEEENVTLQEKLLRCVVNGETTTILLSACVVLERIAPDLAKYLYIKLRSVNKDKEINCNSYCSLITIFCYTLRLANKANKLALQNGSHIQNSDDNKKLLIISNFKNVT